MACRLAGAKPLSEPMLGNCCLDHRNKFKWTLNRHSYIFIQENAFENVVWEMAANRLGLNVLKELLFFENKCTLILISLYTKTSNGQYVVISLFLFVEANAWNVSHARATATIFECEQLLLIQSKSYEVGNSTSLIGLEPTTPSITCLVL